MKMILGKKLFSVLSILVILLAVNAEALSEYDENIRLLKQLDMLDTLDFQESIDKANKCTEKRNFDCTRKNLKKAKKFVKTGADREEITYAKKNLKAEIAYVEEEAKMERELRRERRRMREVEEEAEMAAEREEEIRRENQPAQKSAWAVAAMDALDKAGDDLLRQQRETHARTEAALRQHYADKRRREQKQAERQQEARRNYERKKSENDSRRAQLLQQKEDRASATRQKRDRAQRQRQREREAQRIRERQVLAQSEASRKERDRQNRINKERKREQASAAKTKEFNTTVYESIAFIYKTKAGNYSGQGPTQKLLTSEKSKERALELVGCSNQRGSMGWRANGHSGEMYFCNQPLQSYNRDVAAKIGVSHLGGQTVFHCQENWTLNWRKYCK